MTDKPLDIMEAGDRLERCTEWLVEVLQEQTGREWKLIAAEAALHRKRWKVARREHRIAMHERAQADG